MRPGLLHLHRSEVLSDICGSNDKFPAAHLHEQLLSYGMQRRRKALIHGIQAPQSPHQRSCGGKGLTQGFRDGGVRLARLDFLKGICGFHLVRGLA